jgi:hypothetical protein
MSERVSIGAAGHRPAVSGGGTGRAGYAKVTAGPEPGNTSRRHGCARPGLAPPSRALRESGIPDG